LLIARSLDNPYIDNLCKDRNLFWNFTTQN